MKNKFLLLLIGLFLGINNSFAQDENFLLAYLQEKKIEATAIKEGLYYNIQKEGKGNVPKIGDYVKVHYKGSLLDGTVFDSSEVKEPFVFQIGYRQVINGWDLGIRSLSEGSKGTLYISPAFGYGSRSIGEHIPPNSTLILEVELLKILTFDEYDDYMVALEEKERIAYEENIKAQFKEDKKKIQAYCLDHQLKAKRTTSGLSYIITKKGKGDFPKTGDKLQVHYEGYLLDGTLFDSTAGKDAFSAIIGKKKLIQGWEEGLRFFNKGSEGWLLIPAKLAYGSRSIKQDEINIPENSVLIFKIKVEKIEEL